MKKLLTGNEAIARGAFEAGVTVASAYPGTPSTEILENFARYEGVYAEWAPNEKVALEVGIGASIAGARVLVTMKHVGVNVAADPLFTFAYTGVNGGLMLISADDPGMHSSQNEQDNRHLARAAKIPVLEPSDSQEAKDMAVLAYEISETFDTPVMLRTTTRVAHSQSLVELGEQKNIPLKEYKKNPAKYVMMPAMARARHVFVEERLLKLADYAETAPFNFTVWGNKKIGIIASGITYQYAKEVLTDVSFLKIGMTYPLPKKLITEFINSCDEVYVLEELEPFIEDQIKAWGLKVKGKEVFSLLGEYSAAEIASKIDGVKNEDMPCEDIAGRPPVMCPGCPHRGVFYTLNKLKLTVTGDIGCYTLGALAPLSAIDTCICMGASIGTALGMEKARGKEFARKIVAVIGDSTFLHSGVTGLMDVIYNNGSTTTMILDNSITAMTGHQHNPATGRTLQGQPTKAVDLAALVRALGVERVVELDPNNLTELEKIIKQEVAADEPSVIIAKRPCALIVKNTDAILYEVDKDVCIGCKICLRVGCPAIAFIDKKSHIDDTLCVGCDLCAQVCPTHAIVKAGGSNE